MQSKFQTRMRLLCGLALYLPLAACTHGTSERPQQSSRLGALAVLYGRFIGSHSGKSPGSQEEFVSFIDKSGRPTLKQFSLSQSDELFEADADGQQVIVVYGRGNVNEPNPIIAYESHPRGDQRKVVRSTGTVEEISESEFQKHQPARASR